MEKFEITILGCGSALPTLRHLPTSQIVNIREKLFMIDCGEGTQLQLRKSKLKFSKINHIFISHLHGDHLFGLIGLISTMNLLGRTSVLHIYGPKDLEPLLRPQLNYFCNGMMYDVEIHTIDPKEHKLIYEDRSVEIHTIPLKHRILCCGFLFKEKQTLPHIKSDMIKAYNIPISQINNIKAGMDYISEDGEIIRNSLLTVPARAARSYAYCSDTIYLPENANLLQEVDLLYHEATFCNEDERYCKSTFHSTASQAANLAKLSNAKQLMIGHYSSRYQDEAILLKEAQEIFPNTILALENFKIRI
jgi:ribonuclease Z